MVTLDDIRSRRGDILRISARHGGHDVRVFGSVVRGQAAEDSDIDFLIRLDKGRSLLDHIAIMQDLEDLLGHKVDIVTEGALHWAIREEVLAEAVEL